MRDGSRRNIGPPEPAPEKVFDDLRAIANAVQGYVGAFEWIFATNDVLIRGAVRVVVAQLGQVDGLLYREKGVASVVGTEDPAVFGEFIEGLWRAYQSGTPGAIEAARAIRKGGINRRR